MEAVVDLQKKMEHHRQEMERIKNSIFHLENEKKKKHLKNHMGEWFLNGDFYTKPLKISGTMVTVLSIGEYEGLPFMEIEKVDIHNVPTDLLGGKIPEEVQKIQKDLQNWTSMDTKSG
tara:strand:+ start:1121 stop:1474 length:354 start_codon:yes stop_codon:yes gene_type:complete